ncbi:MAG: glycine--tRNA ligase subunit beta [Peptococcaceae bacterium]|nr:glycine--tRNA ligase subunit beta [Peptococcaceae bacterium]
MADYLLEIGTEEIPAKFMPRALDQLKELAAEALEEKRIAYGEIRSLGTPRRLALIVKDMAEKGQDLSEEVRGPARKAAFDPQGNPTKAVLGFARGQGVTVESLTVKEINGNEYVYATKHTAGVETKPYLQTMIPDLVGMINFPKTMRWGDLDYRFPRPIRWIVSLWNQEVLPFVIAGVPAGKTSRGHRFLGSGQVELTGAENYEKALEAQFVMVDPARRREESWKQIQAVAQANHAVVEEDQELIEEVTYLIEWPTALLGSFSESYLEIPEEVVITPMREHQRYFPVRDKEGKLMNRFVTVRNGGERSLDLVAAGNEKVLAARLSDARFFWDEDRKQPLEAYLPKLEKVVFQEKLGSVGDKVRRIQKLTAYLAEALNADDETKFVALRGAHLAKADLVTNMVFEFTELQGIMGRYYALECGEKPAVAEAVLEHYQPRFAGDATARTRAGALVAIADKMDTIAGIFAVGIEPTGSQDPYALRRAAMGICQTIINQDLDLDLDALIAKALEQYAFILADASAKEQTAGKIKDFFNARIRNILSDGGHRYDVVDAVMAVPFNKIGQVTDRAMALSAMREDQAFKQLLAVFTRANNLAKKSVSWMIDPSLLKEECEMALHARTLATQAALPQVMEKQGLRGVIAALARLAEPLNAFFDGVMVMAEDEDLRNTRLALLNAIVEMTKIVGDLSRLAE